jgi:uracil-DNA glycosylase
MIQGNVRVKSLQLCKRCSLSERRKQIVIGRGAIPAEVLFIGEAPGRTEDILGEPFVGQAGRLLSILLQEIPTKFSYYITNTVLCRPCEMKGGDNRQPKPDEIIKCRSNVEFIIRLVHPRLTVFLGKIPETYCSDLVQDYVALLHPSFLLRTGGINSPYYLPTKNKLLTKLKEVFDVTI